ncbi:MAG: ATP-binding protein, partial [Flavobacteriales bacterium]
LSEFGLSAEEMICIHQEISANDFFPLNQELLDIKAERSSYYISGILRPRLIELTLNKEIPKVERNSLRSKGLYLERSANEIAAIELCYNHEEEVLFSEVFHLASAMGPDSNSTLTLLLHGLSGTGKTEFANQLARQLGGGLMQLNFPEIQSKYIGETEKNLQKVFELYQRTRKERTQPLVLLINEADGIMNNRVRINSSNDAFHNQTQSVMLELLESSSGIIVATTNQLQSLDHAFYRRFMFKQEIRLPQRDARVAIIKNLDCTQYMGQRVIELLENNEWSPGALAILVNRVKRLSAIKKLNDDDIISMLMSEGIIKSFQNIGFQFNSKIKSNESRT